MHKIGTCVSFRRGAGGHVELAGDGAIGNTLSAQLDEFLHGFLIFQNEWAMIRRESRFTELDGVRCAAAWA